jgi:hypothetical protein
VGWVFMRLSAENNLDVLFHNKRFVQGISGISEPFDPLKPCVIEWYRLELAETRIF